MSLRNSLRKGLKIFGGLNSTIFIKTQLLMLVLAFQRKKTCKHQKKSLNAYKYYRRQETCGKYPESDAQNSHSHNNRQFSKLQAKHPFVSSLGVLYAQVFSFATNKYKKVCDKLPQTFIYLSTIISSISAKEKITDFETFFFVMSSTALQYRAS